MTRSMLDYAKLSQMFFIQGMRHSIDILNRMGRAILQGRSSYGIIYEEPADMRFFIIFGARAYVHVEARYRKKQDPKAIVGYYGPLFEKCDSSGQFFCNGR